MLRYIHIHSSTLMVLTSLVHLHPRSLAIAKTSFSDVQKSSKAIEFDCASDVVFLHVGHGSACDCNNRRQSYSCLKMNLSWQIMSILYSFKRTDSSFLLKSAHCVIYTRIIRHLKRAFLLYLVTLYVCEMIRRRILFASNCSLGPNAFPAFLEIKLDT